MFESMSFNTRQQNKRFQTEWKLAFPEFNLKDRDHLKVLGIERDKIKMDVKELEWKALI